MITPPAWWWPGRRLSVDAEEYEQLLSGGYDVASVEETAEGFVVQVVLRPNDRNKLRREGFDFAVVRNSDGQTSAEAALQQQAGFTVWRPWDGGGGLDEQIRDIAAQYPKLVKLHTIGTTHQGRDILALRVTSNARNVPLGVRPAVLYQSTAHAREWISTEVNQSGLGAWTVSGPPAGSASNPNDWFRTQSVDFEEGAAVSTVRSLFFGFGLEGITGAADRTAVMDRSLDYLLGP